MPSDIAARIVRLAGHGLLACALFAVLHSDARAQAPVPQPPAPGQAASDFLTADVARAILGPSVEARTVGPTQCWYVESGYTMSPPKDKSVMLTVWHWAQPRSDDVTDIRSLLADNPSPNAVTTELTDFADAGLWTWKSGAGTLRAVRGGSVRIEVTICGLPRDAALQAARNLATGPLGGRDATNFAYAGTPRGDAMLAALAAATAPQSTPDSGAAAPESAPADVEVAPAESDTTPASPDTAQPDAEPSAAPQDAAAADGSASPVAADAAAAPDAPAAPEVADAADAALRALPDALTNVAGASYVTQAQVLGQLHRVSLRLDLAKRLQDWIPQDEARADVIEALAPYGIEVVDSADFMLEVKVLYFSTEVEWDGEARHTHEFLVSMDFVTLVAMRRGGSFHGVYAAVAGDRVQGSVFESNSMRQLFFGDELTPDMHEELPSLLGVVLSSIAANDNVDDSPWYAAGWSDDEQSAGAAAFVAAMGSPATSQQQHLGGIDSAPAYQLYEPQEDEYCSSSPWWGTSWEKAFKELGWEKEAAAADCRLALLHVFSCEHVDVINTPDYYRLMNVMQLKESNAVFALGERLVRKPAALMSWFRIDAAFDGDELESIMYDLDDAVDLAIDDVKAAAR